MESFCTKIVTLLLFKGHSVEAVQSGVQVDTDDCVTQLCSGLAVA